MDPAVFGYIRVSQAEGARAGHPEPHLHRPRLGPEHATPGVDDAPGDAPTR